MNRMARRSIPVLIVIVFCLCLVLSPIAQGQSTQTRTFTESYLKGLPLTGGYYSCLKQQSPYSYFWQDWYGFRLSYLLDNVIGLQAGTQGVKVYAVDGMEVDLTLDRIRNPNSQGLYAIVAWQKGVEGAAHQAPPLTTLSETEDGTFRLALGQSPNVGTYASGGTPNFPYFEKWVRTIEVLPLPAGMTKVDPSTVPAGQVVVYGNISAPTTGCGQSAGTVALGFGLMMGLLSLGGSGLLRRRRGRKSR